MISKEKLVEDRSQENLDHTYKLTQGEVRRTFFAEKTNAIDEDWFEDVKKDIDEKHRSIIPKPSPYYKQQYGSAFALQRDVNTRYSQRVYMLKYALDQKFDLHATSGFIAKINEYREKIDEPKDIEVDPNNVSNTVG